MAVVRWWLVLATLGVLAGTASAKREPDTCLCGATLWTLPPTSDTPDQPIIDKAKRKALPKASL
jgi:hypothetical protein